MAMIVEDRRRKTVANCEIKSKESGVKRQEKKREYWNDGALEYWESQRAGWRILE
jgi:hypothetical protein